MSGCLLVAAAAPGFRGGSSCCRRSSAGRGSQESGPGGHRCPAATACRGECVPGRRCDGVALGRPLGRSGHGRPAHSRPRQCQCGQRPRGHAPRSGFLQCHGYQAAGGRRQSEQRRFIRRVAVDGGGSHRQRRDGLRAAGTRSRREREEKSAGADGADVGRLSATPGDRARAPRSRGGRSRPHTQQRAAGRHGRRQRSGAEPCRLDHENGRQGRKHSVDVRGTAGRSRFRQAVMRGGSESQRCGGGRDERARPRQLQRSRRRRRVSSEQGRESERRGCRICSSARGSAARRSGAGRDAPDVWSESQRQDHEGNPDHSRGPGSGSALVAGRRHPLFSGNQVPGSRAHARAREGRSRSAAGNDGRHHASDGGDRSRVGRRG